MLTTLESRAAAAESEFGCGAHRDRRRSGHESERKLHFEHSRAGVSTYGQPYRQPYWQPPATPRRPRPKPLTASHRRPPQQRPERHLASGAEAVVDRFCRIEGGGERMHFALAAVLLASDHTATPSSEATDGIASPQHRRCASSRRRPSRSGRGGRVGSLPVRVWWNGLGAVPSGPPQLRMRRRKATALPTGRDRERRRRRDAGRACRPPEAARAVHCHSSCPSPWATPLRNAHLWRRFEDRSFASTDDSSRRGDDPLRSGSSRSRRRRRNEFAAPVDIGVAKSSLGE